MPIKLSVRSGTQLIADVLVVCHTEAGAVVRIISARRATNKERSFYEEGS